jgi:hypothetical protein
VAEALMKANADGRVRATIVRVPQHLSGFAPKESAEHTLADR